jgi:energy-coupling factor transporter ATP-binding protein EcfA2
MKPKIIGLCGPKGVGKSTYAKTIEGAVILSFATPIKEMLKVILPGQKYLNFKEEPIPQFPAELNARRLLQSLGTEWGREKVYPNVWVDIAYKIAQPYIGKKTIVFDDIRFPNEHGRLEDGDIPMRLRKSYPFSERI